jgi:hypothetical protein
MTGSVIVSDVSAFIILIGAIILTVDIRWFLSEEGLKEETKKFGYGLMFYGILEIIIGLGISSL